MNSPDALQHSRLLNLPLALDLLDHQLRIATNLELDTPRVFGATEHGFKGGDERVVFGLVVGIALPKLESLRLLGLAADRQLIRSVARPRIADASAIEDDLNRYLVCRASDWSS